MKRLLAFLTAIIVLAVSFWVSPVAAETALAAPAAPTGFQVATYSASRINLSWNAVSGATSYQVYRSTGASTTFTRIAIVTTRSYQNTGLLAATRYNYKVRAVVSGVLGSFTAVKTVYTKPATPAGLTATAISTSQIDLKWSAVTGATSYQVYRSYGASTSYTRVAIVTAPSYSNTGLASGTRYNYKVRAVKSGNIGDFTAAKTAYTKPTIPTGLSAKTISTSQIDLSWTAVSGATSYQVYRSTGTSTSYTRIAIVTAPAYSNKGLASGTRYNYKVCAVKSGSIGGFTAVKTTYTKPAALAGLTATAQSSSSIKLTWMAVTGATKYYVYRSASATGTFAKVGEATVATYTNTGLAANTTYYYKVSAVNAGGASAMSAAVTLKTLAAKPATPTGLAAAAQSTSSIKLTWTAVTGATKYYVYRSASATGTFAKVGEATAATYTNTGLTANTTYYYKVSAVNAGGEGVQSAAASAKTLAPGLPAPGSFSASTYNYQSVQLTYDVVQNAAKYRIYYSEIASSNINDYGYFDWASKDCRVIGLDAATTYYFRVAAVDAQGQVGIPTGFVSATTSASPGNPPQPKFYLSSIMNVGSSYRMIFDHGYSVNYPSALDTTFEFYAASTEAGLAADTPDIVSAAETMGPDNTYFYEDVAPGQSYWYGFRACYGPYKSAMQKLHVAALGKPTNVYTGPIGKNVNLYWNSVYAAARYNIYVCIGPPNITVPWAEFKASTPGDQLWCLGYTTGTSAAISGMPNYSSYYYIVVPTDANGVEGWFYGYAIGTVFY